MVKPLKEITKEEVDLLIKKNILIMSGGGLVNKDGFPVSYTTTKHKRFIMDSYADMAKTLMRGCEDVKKET